MLLPSGALTLAKESGYRAVRITNLNSKRHSPQKTLNLPPRYLRDSSAWSHPNQPYFYPTLL